MSIFQMVLLQSVVPGHYIFATSIQVDLSKTEVILMLPTPHTPIEVRSLLGYASYYCRFIAIFQR